MSRLIDPIYRAYSMRVIKYLASTEFYDYFMANLESGKNTFQFSNRKVEKSVDEAWVLAIEAVIKPMEEIIANPRNFIVQEEVIVNIALAKRVTPESIRHLSQHGNMIDTVTDDNVRPNRLMNKFKEDTWNTYENRFVYTLLEMVYEFVDKRYEAIFAALGEEYGAYLKLNSQVQSYHEAVTANIDLRIQQEENLIATDEKNETIFSRIARLHRIFSNFRQTSFAQEVAKYGKIKPPLVRTNAIAKNQNFKACHKLWNFILAYSDIGYSIKIFEQSTDFDDSFTRDVYHSILFNYIILKNHLEDPKDREINLNKKFKKKQIKPKFVTEIIEEIVKDYDLPDIEIRKVLIEELTKKQLMEEEEETRLKLVEAKEKEMLEKQRQEKLEQERQKKEAEKERLRQEKAALREHERLQKEQEAELLRQKKEQERREKADLARIKRLYDELEFFKSHREQHVKYRSESAKKVDQIRTKELEKKAQQEALSRKKETLEAEQATLHKARQKEKEQEKLRLEKERQKARQKAIVRKAKEKERQKSLAQKKRAIERQKARLQKEKEIAIEKTAHEKEKKKIADKAAKDAIAQEKAEARAKKAALAQEQAAVLTAVDLSQATVQAVEQKPATTAPSVLVAIEPEPVLIAPDRPDLPDVDAPAEVDIPQNTVRSSFDLARLGKKISQILRLNGENRD